MTDFTELVENHITEHFEDLFTVTRVALIDWDSSVDTLHAPFGYLPPVFDGNEEVTLRICPALIVAQVAHLDEEDALSYVLFLEHHINLHLVHHEMGEGPELERLIDRIIYDNAPSLAAEHNEVQARAVGMGAS